MNKDRFSWLNRLLGPALSLVMAVGLLQPTASLAAILESVGGGGGGGTGDEGDPLDSNDTAGGGYTDPEHETSVTDRPGGGTISFLPDRYEGLRILMIPEFQSGTLVFRLLILRTSSLGLEE